MCSKISVIVPVYNDFNTIERALLSVVNQSYNDGIHIIVIDDGSEASMQGLLSEIAENNKSSNRYFSVLSQKNKGVSAARNYGVSVADSKYIAFLDADDEWHYDKISIQYDILERQKLKFLASIYIYDEFPKGEFNIELKRYTFKQMLVRNRFSTPSVIMKREHFNSLGGFDENLSHIEDYDLWLRSALEYNLYIVCNPPLVRLHKFAYGVSGLSSNMKKMYSCEKKVYKKLLKNKKISFIRYCMMSILLRIKLIKRLIVKLLK